MGWVVAVAVVVGIVVALWAIDARRDDERAYRDATTVTLDDAVRNLANGTEPPEPDPYAAPLPLRWPRLTGLVAGVVVLAVGALVVIALASERRSPP